MNKPILDTIKETCEIFEKYELTKGELARAEELAYKLENQKITVSVIGQFKRGKSTLVNAILQDKILPVGIVPVTAVVTTIEYGEKAATVHFSNGIIKEISFDEMSSFINEQENQDNHLGVSQVALYCPADFLAGGMTFVDTPGVGSVHQKNTDEAYSYVKESDAVIFMLSVDSPINQIEIDFLKNAKEYASKFYFAINKIDSIDEDDLADYLAYCRNLICKLMDADDINLFPVSAKKNIGIDELKTAILEDCQTTVKDIIADSAKLKMRDIVASALSQITLYRTALQLTHKEFDEKFAEIEAMFAEVQAEAAEFAEHFRSNPRMLEAHMNDIKNQLSAKVSELFGIEYHYNISTVDFFRGGVACEDGSRDLRESFTAAVGELCADLKETLMAIFMHREENAYKVARRINDLNRLVRKLVQLRGELAE
ncbi:MAG: dynamin family protein [Firmicutes bacterium]|nr:dynamin family protein [Bacillota bacterium]